MTEQVYKVRDPNGNIREIRGPAGATDEQVIEQAKILFAEKPAVVSAGEMLRKVPRQVGLTARAGAEGLADVVSIGSEPIRAVLNPALRAMGLPGAPSPREMVARGADAVGLPKPENPTERVVGDAARTMAGAGGMMGAASRGANALTGTGRAVAEALSANPGMQGASAVGAGASGGAVREAGGSEGEQFAASLLGGLGLAGITDIAERVGQKLGASVGTLLKPKQAMGDVNIVLNQILSDSGVNVSSIPGNVRAELAFEVKKAMDTGRQVNPDVVRRIADYAAVGATPTKGTVTLDPVQITQERNLAKMGANSTDPRLQVLARTQGENNATLIRNLNDMGAAGPNAGNASGPVVNAIQSRDAAARAKESALYGKARDSQGRALELDSEGFVADAYNRLADGNKGAFLPDTIGKVLETLRSGKIRLPDGSERPAPFTVDTIDNLKTMLATASRGASDGNVRAAIKSVRDALEGVQIKPVGRAVGGEQAVDPARLAGAQARSDSLSQEAMDAFDAARRFARARRNWQESAPGISAALDDPNPDRFVKDYILSNSSNASSADVARMMFTIRKSPEATQAVKENLVGYLKGKALSGASDEVGNFSASGYNKALNELGDKLKLFFKPEEIAQLRALGRVASYETAQPRGSAVNNSNTTGALVGILDKIASSGLLGRLPFADAAIRTPARNWSTQISIKNAMDPAASVVTNPPSPESLRLERLFGPGLLLATPNANGRNDERRR